MLRYLLNNTL